MRDFAALLIDARQQAGLTQSRLAQEAELTPSYLCFIEKRRKPPPSDQVCRRLAAVLDIDPDRLIEIAQLERAPATLQKRLATLDRSLRRERRSRRKLLESLLSPILFAGPPGYAESALEALGLSRPRRNRIREVLRAVGRKHQDREREVSRIVEELPEQERNTLLEALPRLLGERDHRATSAAGASSAMAGQEGDPPPVFAAPPSSPAVSPAVSPAASPSSAAPAAPPLCYTVPVPGTGHEGTFLIEATNAMGQSFEDLRAGDHLLVDPAEEPGTQDLVILRGEKEPLLRRLVGDGDRFVLAASDQALRSGDLGRDAVDRAAMLRRLADSWGGTVLEIRRPLRPRGRRNGARP